MEIGVVASGRGPAVLSSSALPCAEVLIEAQVNAARLACEQLTEFDRARLLDSVNQACRRPDRPEWGRKAAAHAEIFRLLADIAGGSPGGPHDRQVQIIRDLISAVGPTANGIITNSRRRLLARLGAGDADGAAREVESHLRTLNLMWRLTCRPAA